MDFLDLPQDLKLRLLSRAANHDGTSALDMFSEIPDNIRDSVSEINVWLDTHQWSHIFPKSRGGIDAVWETTFLNPNQTRGESPMTLQEQLKIVEQNKLDAELLEPRFSDDISGNIFDNEVFAVIPDWSSSLEQALAGAGLAGVAGYAVAFAFTLARNIIKHRDHLLKSREFRKHFLVNILEQANKQGIRGGALAFLISFICMVFPPFQFLLVTGAFVGLARLGVELFASVVDHIDPNRNSFVSKIFDFSRGALNFAVAVLSSIWASLNVVVDWILEGLAKVVGSLLRIGKQVFESVLKMMDWLLGVPVVVTPC